jgi:hypothetical protein
LIKDASRGIDIIHVTDFFDCLQKKAIRIAAEKTALCSVPPWVPTPVGGYDFIPLLMHKSNINQIFQKVKTSVKKFHLSDTTVNVRLTANT